MTDAELNKAVAEEVMGWKKQRDGRWMEGGRFAYWLWRERPEVLEDRLKVFSPAISYAAMGEVLEAMKKRGYRYYLWQFIDNRHGARFLVPFELGIDGIADTLPRAVALAALEACRKEQSK